MRAWLSGAVVCALSTSCSASDDGPAQLDSGIGRPDTGGLEVSTDGSADTLADVVGGDVADAAFDAAPRATCGLPPYVSMRLIARTAEGGGPRAGVTIKTTLCETITLVTGTDGQVVFDVTKGSTLAVRYTGEGLIPTAQGVWKIDADYVDAHYGLVPETSRSRLPTWPSGTALLFVSIYPQATTGPCSDPSGVTVSLPSDTGAKVTYFDESPLPKVDPALTVTGKNGWATITELLSTFDAEIVATKPGCKIDFQIAPATGKTPVINDTITFADGYMSNP